MVYNGRKKQCALNFKQKWSKNKLTLGLRVYKLTSNSLQWRTMIDLVLTLNSMVSLTFYSSESTKHIKLKCQIKLEDYRFQKIKTDIIKRTKPEYAGVLNGIGLCLK